MKKRPLFCKPMLSAFLFCVIFSGMAYAGPPDLFDFSGLDMESRYYAASDPQAPGTPNDTPSRQTKPGTDTAGRRLHRYLGYGTLVAAGLAAVTGSDEDYHCAPGYAAAGLAALTCMNGFLEYGEYFDFSNGLNAYNTHILLGSLATAGFIATAILAESDEDHAGVGAASGISAVVPVVIIKW